MEHQRENFQLKLKNENTMKKDSKMKCFKCGLIGHRAKFCKNAKKVNELSASGIEDISLYVNETEHNSLQIGSKKNSGFWCFDSGCTSHMCKNIESFTEKRQSNNPSKLNLANNGSTNIAGRGTVNTIIMTGNTSKSIKLDDTLYVPDLRTNLISVSKITDKGHNVIFDKNKAEVIDNSGNVLLTAKRERDLYYFQKIVNPECKKICETNSTMRTPKKNSLEDWHIKMGHLNLQSLREATRTGAIRGIKIEGFKEDFDCRTCIQGKCLDLLFQRYLRENRI